jgi:hypothetical protein
MGVEKFLDAGTGHITYADSIKLLEDPEGFPSRVITHEFGWWINVCEKKLLQNEMIQPMRDEGYSEGFVNLIKAASASDCWWINLDCDGGYVDGLRIFKW